MPAKKMLQCATKVNKEAVKRKVIDGVEHIIVSSFTLPDNIVMNNCLYPAEEIAKSFQSLERTLAPIEHPTDSHGNFISASDPHAINQFYAGAYNTNVTRQNGRVHVEKTINVQEALKSDRGKRLLDRIEELESSENPRAIHTSVGVWVSIESLDEPRTNGEGLEYNSIATDLIFDHDAILLDSVGAAKPNQGVGIAVNSDGDKFKIEKYELTCNAEFAIHKYPAFHLHQELEITSLSFAEIIEGLEKALLARYAEFNNPPVVYIIYDSVTSTNFVYSENDKLFKSSYSIDEKGNISIQDDREEVKRSVEYVPLTQPTEDSTMRDTILAKLKELGIIVANNEISDSELLAKYEEALSASSGDDDAHNEQLQVNKDLRDANQKLAGELQAVRDELQANRDKEVAAKIKTIQACGKYSALPESALRHMANNDAEEFAKLYNTSKPAVGILPTDDFGGSDNSSDDMFAVNGGK